MPFVTVPRSRSMACSTDSNNAYATIADMKGNTIMIMSKAILTAIVAISVLQLPAKSRAFGEVYYHTGHGMLEQRDELGIQPE